MEEGYGAMIGPLLLARGLIGEYSFVNIQVLLIVRASITFPELNGERKLVLPRGVYEDDPLEEPPGMKWKGNPEQLESCSLINVKPGSSSISVCVDAHEELVLRGVDISFVLTSLGVFCQSTSSSS